MDGIKRTTPLNDCCLVNTTAEGLSSDHDQSYWTSQWATAIAFTTTLPPSFGLDHKTSVEKLCKKNQKQKYKQKQNRNERLQESAARSMLMFMRFYTETAGRIIPVGRHDMEDIPWCARKIPFFLFLSHFFIVIKHRNYIVPKKIQISVLEETVMNIQLVHLIIRA